MITLVASAVSSNRNSLSIAKSTLSVCSLTSRHCHNASANFHITSCSFLWRLKCMWTRISYGYGVSNDRSSVLNLLWLTLTTTSMSYNLLIIINDYSNGILIHILALIEPKWCIYNSDFFQIHKDMNLIHILSYFILATNACEYNFLSGKTWLSITRKYHEEYSLI